MIYADLPAGATVFLDASVFIYCIAVMRVHGLTNLASADPDFDRVPGITRYGPV
jgi:predicted nucleic acid-binding protein